jgi:hypothetical protein
MERAKTILDAAKSKLGLTAEDQDLIDHLDPASPFRMDLGGQG